MVVENGASPEVIDIFVGPRFRYLTHITKAADDYCLLGVDVPSGVTVPIHSHADRETFYILTGELHGFAGPGWQVFGPGDAFDVVGGVRHAIRNPSGTSVSFLLVTTMRMGQFFRDVGRPVTAAPLSPPTPADLERFAKISNSYGYWLGDPQDNAAIGIALP